MTWLADSGLAAVVAGHRACILGAAPGSDALAAFFARCHGALESAGENHLAAPTESAPPVTGQIPAALAAARDTGDSGLIALADAFAALAGRLTWRRREGLEGAANFADGYANADLIGPDGLARHNQVRLGVSLVAPGVTYPNHNHPPEEGYLVLSGGAWRQGAGPWMDHRPGQTVHNVDALDGRLARGPVPNCQVTAVPRPGWRPDGGAARG
ncbi:MAG: dimethylsulfonioproprionate lyase family protein [Thalassobaculaceae bacterium]